MLMLMLGILGVGGGWLGEMVEVGYKKRVGVVSVVERESLGRSEETEEGRNARGGCEMPVDGTKNDRMTKNYQPVLLVVVTQTWP